MSEQVRREVRELVDGFGPPSPGLAARAVAGLPDRRVRTGRTVPRWTVVVAAALTVVIGLSLWFVRSVPRQPSPVPAGMGQLERRPLASVPLDGRNCQVAKGTVVAQTDGTVTLVGGSGLPLAAPVTVQAASKPLQASTVVITAGPDVSGPVLVRGHRLDAGAGMLLFALAPAAPTQRALALEAGPGTRRWDVSLQASLPGCYAIQIDGARFSEEALLQLWPPTTSPTPQTMYAIQARAAVRAGVTAARPILLPAEIPADWRTQVTTTADGFTVQYSDPGDPARTVTVAIGLANPPSGATQSRPDFHGDQRSLYQVSGGARVLLWHQPGVYDHADPSYPGVPYALTATGLTDAEFWLVANSLA